MTARDTLAAQAERLRSLHVPVLVLANAWDATTAKLVSEAGGAVVATSSHAVAESAGAGDGEALDVERAFAAVAEIASVVTVPVTADLEAGYGLEPGEFVERLLGAGAVGCNLEDSDHHGPGVLVDAATQAARIAAVKEAGRLAGVDVVVNARTDAFARHLGSPAEQLDESVRRGRLYREAGADCVYPIGVGDQAAIATLVAELGMVNVMMRPGGPTVDELRALGVARASVGSGLARIALQAFTGAARSLLSGADGWWEPAGN